MCIQYITQLLLSPHSPLTHFLTSLPTSSPHSPLTHFLTSLPTSSLHSPLPHFTPHFLTSLPTSSPLSPLTHFLTSLPTNRLPHLTPHFLTSLPTNPLPYHHHIKCVFSILLKNISSHYHPPHNPTLSPHPFIPTNTHHIF